MNMDRQMSRHLHRNSVPKEHKVKKNIKTSMLLKQRKKLLKNFKKLKETKETKSTIGFR